MSFKLYFCLFRFLDPKIFYYLYSYLLFGLLARITDLSQSSDNRNDSWKNTAHISKKKRSWLIHNIYLKRSKYFESLYLGNRLRYRDKIKSGFNAKAFFIFRARQNLMRKFFLSYFFLYKMQTNSVYMLYIIQYIFSIY